MTAGVLALLVLVPSTARAIHLVRITVERQPLELIGAARYLDRVAPASAVVMALKANVAYLSHRQWQELPGATSVDELRTMLRGQPPDYLVYDNVAARFEPQLLALANPETAPGWLQEVYRDPGRQLVVYAVARDRL